METKGARNKAFQNFVRTVKENKNNLNHVESEIFRMLTTMAKVIAQINPPEVKVQEQGLFMADLFAIANLLAEYNMTKTQPLWNLITNYFDITEKTARDQLRVMRSALHTEMNKVGSESSKTAETRGVTTCDINNPQVIQFLDLMNQLKWDSTTLKSFAQLFQYLESFPSTPLWQARYAQGQYLALTQGRKGVDTLPSYLYALVQMNCPHLDVLNSKLASLLREQNTRKEKFGAAHALSTSSALSFPISSETERQRVLQEYNPEEDKGKLTRCYTNHLDDIVNLTHLLEEQQLDRKTLFALLHFYEKQRGVFPFTRQSEFRGPNVPLPRAKERKYRGFGAGEREFDKPNLFYTILTHHCSDLNELNQYLQRMKTKRDSTRGKSGEWRTKRIIESILRRNKLKEPTK